MSKRSHNSANRRPSSKRSNRRRAGGAGAVRLTSAAALVNLALHRLPSLDGVNYTVGRTYPCIQIDCDEGQLVFFEAGYWGPYFALFGGPVNDPTLWGTYVLKLSAGPVCLVCVDHLLLAARTGAGGSARIYRARSAQLNHFSVTHSISWTVSNGNLPASTTPTLDLGPSTTADTSGLNSGLVASGAHETTPSPADVGGQVTLDMNPNLGFSAPAPVVADPPPCASASRRTHTADDAPETVLGAEDVLAGTMNFDWGPPHQRRFLCAIRGLSCIEPRLDAVRPEHIVTQLSCATSRAYQKATLNFLRMCFAELVRAKWWTGPDPTAGIDLATVPLAKWRTRLVAKREPTAP
jgi:hypothetical protein